MEIIMRKWYAFLSGKKMLGAGLAAVVALTALLAVNFYRGQKNEPVTPQQSVSESLTQTEEKASDEGQKVAEEMNHELPVGGEVGEQQLAQQTPDEQGSLAALTSGDENFAQDGSDSADELAEVAGQTSLVSMNLNFDASQKLQWPVAGRELIKSYSMDSLVYYATLEEYKVCPAIMIQAQPGDAVLAPADGVVSKIASNEEIGNYICLKLGDEYEAIIGNMDNISVSEGDYLLKGTVLGGLAAPTKYYVTEGPNLYFELQKGGQPVDPLDFLE